MGLLRVVTGDAESEMGGRAGGDGHGHVVRARDGAIRWYSQFHRVSTRPQNRRDRPVGGNDRDVLVTEGERELADPIDEDLVGRGGVGSGGRRGHAKGPRGTAVHAERDIGGRPGGDSYCRVLPLTAQSRGTYSTTV